MESSSADSRKATTPGRGWYALSLALFIIGGIGGIAVLFITIFSSLSEGIQFSVPGELMVTVDKPGRHTLFHETSTIYKGHLYQSSPELPDNISIRIYNTETGIELPITTSMESKETVGTTKRHAIANIYFPEAGTYRISVTGTFAERIFYLRRAVCRDILGAVALFIALSIVGWIIAPGIALIVLIKRSGAKKSADQENSAVQPAKGQEQTRPSLKEAQERTLATFCHLGTLAGFLFPLGNIIAPLVIWLIKKDESPLVNDQGKESLNFQISMLIYVLVSALLALMLIGFILLIVLSIFDLIAVIIASVKANSGERYRYPLCIRFIK